MATLDKPKDPKLYWETFPSGKEVRPTRESLAAVFRPQRGSAHLAGAQPSAVSRAPCA